MAPVVEVKALPKRAEDNKQWPESESRFPSGANALARRRQDPPPAAPRRARRSARSTSTRARTAFVAPAVAEDASALRRIEQIVVLMMENRSFDHMLGYLCLEGGREDIDGLQASMANEHEGKRYRVHHLAQTRLEDTQDPCHSSACAADQIAGGNGGFVRSYATSHPADKTPGLVMGFYNGTDLPLYDHLAREFAVCDRWFCAVPGATWPNRLYAVTGQSGGRKDNTGKIPWYDLPSFLRHLDAANVSWRWYAHDVATLRFTDGRYRLGHSGNFSFFDRRSLLNPRNFLDDAADGRLPAVSWIDPNFVDVGFIGPSGSNDDHPPSDVMAGQELVLKLYNALVSGPQWRSTLLVITYDEHGGFFDHVPPSPAPDDRPSMRTYGPRVPALVVSPFVARGSVSSTIFDHTSIIKTILLRFCRRSDGSIPDMGMRVTQANDLGSLLQLRRARAAPRPESYRHAVDQIASWRSRVFRARIAAQASRRPIQPQPLNELQEGYLSARKRLRAAGLPEGQP